MTRRLLQSELARYGVLAVVLVLVEVGLFVLINTILGMSYLIATPGSMIVVILLNWYLGGRLVFRRHTHSPRKELALVVAVSLAGICIQLAVTSFAVEQVRLLPLEGKLAAIVVTFFWNFWMRRRFIYPVTAPAGANAGQGS